MKVVIFCGGLGTRLREASDTIPKPLVNIGVRPIVWHMMKYFAHYGHKDFILCLGYRGHMIKRYFLDYDPYESGDLIMRDGGETLEPARNDISDWSITFAETGLHSNLGQRLNAVRHYIGDDEMFIANYGDQLSDLPLPQYIKEFQATGCVASFVAVQPSQSFHAVQMADSGLVEDVSPIADSDVWINGGYMVLKREIFDYMQEGEELVEEPFQRLIAERKLYAHRYEGFWKAMDTFKDKITFDRMDGTGDRPWEVWRQDGDD
jgi:glucose-1-phosphate cytidylyltransferase